MRPGVPAECSIDVGLGDSGGRGTGPIGHEEATGIRLDGRPVSCGIDAFKGGNQRFVVISILSGPSLGREVIDHRRHHTGVPRVASGQIVERKKEREVSNLIGRIGSQIDLSRGVVILRANVQREAVNARRLGLADVVNPVVDRVRRDHSDLFEFSVESNRCCRCGT